MKRILPFLLLALLIPGIASAQTANTQLSLALTASAYSAGECVGSTTAAGGSAILTVPGMVKSGRPGGTIVAQVDITDPTGANAAIDVLLFNALPTGTYTDHVNCSVATADQAHLVGVVVNTAFSCVLDQPTTTGICQATPAVLMTPATQPPTSSALWAVAIMRGTPTYGSSKTLYMNFKAFPD